MFFMREKLPSCFTVRQTEIPKRSTPAGALLARSKGGAKTLASRPPGSEPFPSKRTQTPSRVSAQVMQTTVLRECAFFLASQQFLPLRQPHPTPDKHQARARAQALGELLRNAPGVSAPVPDSSHPALPRPLSKEKLLFQRFTGGCWFYLIPRQNVGNLFVFIFLFILTKDTFSIDFFPFLLIAERMRER